MANEFWLSDRAWAVIDPLLPRNQPGARRVDDRRVISGIIHVLKSGCRWQDCPSVYGPSTTIYNRFNRWSRRGLWRQIFDELVARAAVPDDLSIDSSAVRAHRSAHGGKGGRKRRVSIARQVIACNHREGTLAWRPDHENPRLNRWLRPRGGFLAYAGKCRRHLGCPLAACRFTTRAAVVGGQRLRRKQPAQQLEFTGNRGRHPVKTQPKASHSI